MNEQVNYAKIQRIQDGLDALTIGTFGTGFVTDAMLHESGVKSTVAQHTSDLVDKQAQLDKIAYIDARQIGCKPEIGFDNTTPLKAFISLGIKAEIKFQPGYYEFSECLIDADDVHLIGARGQFGSTDISTIFVPHNANQAYIIKVGGYTDFTVPPTHAEVEVTNCNLIGITFRDYNYLTSSAKPVTQALLCLTYCTHSTFDLCFSRINNSRAIYFKNTWELNFLNLHLRASSYKGYNLYFDQALSDGISNTSTIIFHMLDVEEISWGVMETHASSVFSNISIDEFIYEHNFNRVFTTTSLINESDYTSATKLPLFKFGFVEGLTITNMNLAGVSKTYFTDGVTTYVDSLFQFDGFYNVSIGQINLNSDSKFINIASGAGDNYSNLTIGNIYSTYRNAILSNGSTTSVDCKFFAQTTKGNINIKSNMLLNNKKVIKGNMLLKGDDLFKLCTHNKNANTIGYDATSFSGFVVKKISTTSYATAIDSLQVLEDVILDIRCNTDSTNIVIERYISSVLNQTITIPVSTPNVFTTFSAYVKACDYIKIKTDNNANALTLDYIETKKGTVTIDSGVATTGTAGTNTTVYFNKKFYTTPVVTISIASGTNTHTAVINGLNANSFNVNANADTRTIYWIACGV